MDRYHILQAIFMSFYSKQLYRDVAINWGGKAFAYLLLLLALSWIALVYQIQVGIDKYYTFNSEQFVAQIPVMTIKDGKLSTPLNHPYKILAPDNQEVLAVIDTSGQYTSLDQAKAPMLVTQTEVITQPKPNEIRTNLLPATLNMVIVPQVINGYVEHYLGYAWIILFILAVFCSFIYRVLQALIYAIFGKLFAAICGVTLTYGQIIQVCLVAITPVIIIASVIDYFNIAVPHVLLIYFLISLVYLFYGVYANKA